MTIHAKKGKMEFKEESQNRWLSPSDFLCRCTQIFFFCLHKYDKRAPDSCSERCFEYLKIPKYRAAAGSHLRASRWLLASSRKGGWRRSPLVWLQINIFSGPLQFFSGLFCVTRDLGEPCLLILSPFEINRQHHTRSWLNLTKIEPWAFRYPGLSTCTHAAVALIHLTYWHLGD